jgi:predicted small lipoprotein YifL
MYREIMSARAATMLLVLAICLGSIGSITACGKKGPLYIPDKEQAR